VVLLFYFMGTFVAKPYHLIYSLDILVVNCCKFQVNSDYSMVFPIDTCV